MDDERGGEDKIIKSSRPPSTSSTSSGGRGQVSVTANPVPGVEFRA